MTTRRQKPELHLVAPRDLETLESCLGLDTGPGFIRDEDIRVREVPLLPQSRRKRLERAKEPFARMWLTWAADDRLLASDFRLLIVALCRSREGRRPVRLTAEVAAEARIPSNHRARVARHLEQLGYIRIESRLGTALTLTVTRTRTLPWSGDS